MTIGIDVDGVLLDTAEFMRTYGERYFKRPPSDPDAYTMEDMFGATKKQVFFFGLRWFLPFYCRKYPPYPKAPKVYERMIRKGHTICQITARIASASRSPLGHLSRRFLKNWLKTNGFNCHRLILCSNDNVSKQKLGHCKDTGAEIMIEDNPDTAMMLAENGIKVLLYDTGYNRNIHHENIVRVKNWDEIEDVIFKE